MKQRLVLFNPIGGIGGAERILLSIAKQIRRLDLPLDIAAVLLGDGPLATSLAALGVDVRVLELPATAAEFGDTQLRGRGRFSSLASLLQTGLLTAPDLLRFSRRVRAVFNDLQPDLIHSNGLKAHVISAFAAPRGVPLLWHVQDYYSQRPVVASILRRLSQGVSRAIACSKDVERDLADVLPGVPTGMIYNRVDTDLFQPEPGDGVKLDALAGLPPAAAGTLRVGLVATYANWKGHDVFLDAIANVPTKLNARFYIVGGPIYSTIGSQFSRAELEDRARGLGIGHRLGFVPFRADTAAVYRSLDVMVHASTRPEPFGLTIAEAMACGTATIVADAGGARELFTDGVDALGHRPGDAASLAEAMTTLITDGTRRASLAANSRATVLERFSEESLGRDLIAAYSEFLPLTKVERPSRTLMVPSPSGDRPALAVPRRIVFLNPIGGLGGAEQSLLRILTILQRFAPQIECHLLAGSDGPLLERARQLGVKAEQFPFAPSLQQFGDSGLRGKADSLARIRMITAMPQVSINVTRTIRWLRDWFARVEPDLIHSNGLKTHLLSALARPATIPLLWHIRDFLGDRPLMRWNLRWLASRATLAVANSNAVADDARRVFRGLPVRTLYNTIDLARFTRGDREPSRLAEMAGLTPLQNVIRFGMVSTYANWKGHDVLMKAFARVKAPVPTRLYIIGDPIYSTPGSQFTRQELEALADSLGIHDRVGFIPFQTDTAEIYRKLDIVVHASKRPEPFGLTIAEAMACGKAVIVSAAGGAKELFTEGVDAIGHEPGNVDSLVRAMERLAADPDLRRRLGDTARQNAVRRFAEEPYARELLELYSTCLMAKRR